MKASPFYIQRIESAYQDRKRSNAQYSMGAFSLFLGVSKSNLSRILSLQRIPNLETISQISDKLELPVTEKRAFAQSVFAAVKSKELADFTTPVQVTSIQNEDFEVIGDWHHVALLELILTKKFQYSPRWIAKRLSISTDEASIAVNRLIRLGLVKEILKEGKKTLARTGERFSTLDKSKTSPHLKLWQKQLLEKSILSLENDPIEKRSVRSLTLAVNPAQLELANQMLQEFIRNLGDVLECGELTEVYNLSVALCPLTKSEEI